MPRFYLTTAIDYVNSRPHLGTAYEKITADVIARFKRLSGVDTHFVMGNDEHSQNVFRRARDLGTGSARVLRPHGAGVPRGLGALDLSFDDFIRTTQPRHKAAVETIVRRIAAAGDLYQADYEGWYCVGCEAFKQEKDLVDGLCPIHRTKPDWIKERNHFFRLSAYRDRLLGALRRASGVPAARGTPQRDPAPARGGPRRHLDQPRRAVVGHPAADRSVQRRLRVVRCADQLRVGGRPRHRPRAVRHVVACRPARDRQGHHALPLRDLAGDADERRPARAAAGVRPWLGAPARREDEQVARHRRRSARSRAALRRRRPAPVPDEGDSVRCRRRLQLRTVRGALQHRPGQQPRQPGEPRDRDGGRATARAS